MVERKGTTAVQQGGAPAAFLVVDSVTTLGPAARGAVVVCGSHGGSYAGAFAAKVGVRGVVFNDAGVGKDRAGIAGLDLLDECRIAAAAVDRRTAEIGDGSGTLDLGVVSHVNATARALGCEPGMRAREAAELLAARAAPAARSAPPATEGRHLLRDGRPRVWALDSASLATEDDEGDVVLTGSHGELLGGRPEKALAANALAAVFNDAGRPVGDGLPGRLPALDARGIAAATVAADSARIGDGRSTYFDGVLSAVNATAAARGARIGITARAFVDLVLAGDPEGGSS